MKRSIITRTLDEELIREELDVVLSYFEQLDVTTFSVMFGYDWSSDAVPDNQWIELEFDRGALMAEIARLEAAGVGRICEDDLYLYLPGRAQDFHFCHETDIHIYFDAPNETTESFYNRWLERGFGPKEWELQENGAPVNRLR